MEQVKKLSSLFKVLSEPNRLRILTSLGLECRPVSAVIADTGLSQTNVSFHLRKLREMNLVRGEKNGSFVFYCISDHELLDLLNRFRDWSTKD
ncbi:MAG: winged helix-turn-helix transcriptional regulator [Gammaproteobacteria bacterium]|uniref:Winged helix-turn-helix transcriptional regulator n=1 Tax=Candidatus Thiopontia autotrophica TaxID=2841688 RepID=A0A8J6TVY6_9GAMM|nr:winged helix-turn-helix transcriptional regulator [Candidatus Thiopontia autotrophica]MBL6969476.1 winged helix-turn-helix transcriptional regulator [Gammaproteobacteria bacterium]